MRSFFLLVPAGILWLVLAGHPMHVSPAARAADDISSSDIVVDLLKADRDRFTYNREVVYGRKFGVALTMDVFRPTKDANRLGLVFVVSGGWVSNREPFALFYAPFVSAMVKRGYTVFTVGHGSQPRFTIPEAVGDMQRALRFVHYHAKHFGIDPDRIGISGMSAGGHLSLMMGTTGGRGDPKARDPIDRASSRVAAVACFFPPTDFLNYGSEGAVAFDLKGLLANFRPAVDVRELDPKTKRLERISDEKALAVYREVSPITHVTAESAPTLIIQGDADKLVPIQQAETFLAKLKKAGVATELVVKKKAGHGWAIGMEKDIAALGDWFDRHLKKK
jgi:acetyl esterase/lipase